MTENLRREAQKRGVNADRLVFAGNVERMEDHLARQRLADLFLDTLAFNAQSTACDALWAGLPLITCPGRTIVSRVAAGLLNAIGLPELIAKNAGDYEKMALALAENPVNLGRIRKKLDANRLTTPLFNTSRYVRHLENLFRQMHERHASGLAPARLETRN
jgi:predicted O-linked N-acetylglucosamine transferase (SPINDLY family)